MKTQIVFIDGENFRQNLITNLEAISNYSLRNKFFRFDIRGLLEDVIGSSNLEIKYYANSIKTPKNFTPAKETLTQLEEIKHITREWTAMLRSQNIENIKAGNLKVKEGKACPKCHKTSEILQEKGVDVRVALELFETFYENKTAELFIVSSDSDLCPVYHKIKDKGGKITYIYFPKGMSIGAKMATTSSILITPKELLSHLLP